MRLYKVTDAKGQTRNGTQWGPGVTHVARRPDSDEQYGEGFLHAYGDPLTAAMLGDDSDGAKLWEATGDVVRDFGWTISCRRLTTICEIPMPKVGLEQRIRFAIFCGLAAPHSSSFEAWAEVWLSGKDRSAESAANVSVNRGSAAF